MAVRLPLQRPAAQDRGGNRRRYVRRRRDLVVLQNVTNSGGYKRANWSVRCTNCAGRGSIPRSARLRGVAVDFGPDHYARLTAVAASRRCSPPGGRLRRRRNRRSNASTSGSEALRRGEGDDLVERLAAPLA
jgi:hypothetical protein